jgi:solute carrier family 6 amino acid transporter-like protein 5/7/9/14
MGDENDVLTKKVDELTATVNRLSKQMEDYMAPGQPQYNNSKKGLEAGYIDSKNGSGPVMVAQTYNDEDDERTVDFSKDENEDRGNWSGRLDFLLACLGYAVGLGNVWRFPYLCYKNGGAVFFIPYVIMLFFVGMPIFYLELSLGQFTSAGPLTCWEMAPLFKGVGVAMVIVSALVAIYYNMIIGWSIYYLCASFTSKLPWEHCDSEWASPWCSEFLKKNLTLSDCTSMQLNATLDGVCYNGTIPYGLWNETLARENDKTGVLPSEEYLNKVVWNKSDGMHDLGGLDWRLCLCLLAAWIIVSLSLIKGIKSSGKVVYFTALFPYAVLIILFIRGLTLEGHYEGIEFYILKPNITKLSEASVWKDAAVQIFFSLSASWGGLIALASYNRFHNDVLRDSLIVSLGNCLTSFFAGFVIFSFLGFLAGKQGTTVDKVADDGVGLAFVVYPAAVTLMPVSPLWAILFFLMLITLGLDSEFALVETVTTSIMDQWPATRKKKWAVILGCAVIMYFLGLTLCTRGGPYLLTLMDTYSGGWNVLLIAFLECLCIGYIYGVFRFREDIRTMVGNNPCGCCNWSVVSPWWIVCWCFFTPLGVLFIMVFSWVDYSKPTMGDYVFPIWAEALGWLMTMVVVCGIVFTAVIMIVITPGGCMERFKTLVNPTPYWGPALPQHRKLVRHLGADFQVDPWGQGVVSPSDVKMEMGGNFNSAYE